MQLGGWAWSGSLLGRTMPILSKKVIYARDIYRAAEEILEVLKKDDGGNVIYFDGWDGLGASAVLRRVAGLLTPAAKTEDPVFHIDCSKWESRRAMQKMIAKQLKLPASVMEMFDAQDEEDDFQGVAKGSRTEIPEIAGAIYQHIQNQYRRFLLIFHNGTSKEMNLNSLGFPVFDRYSRSKMLWSFQGRFRAYSRMKVDGALKNTSTTDVFLSGNSSDIGEDKLSDILRHEAEEVAHEMMNTGGIDWPAAAANCFLYIMKLCRMGSDLATDYDMATHVCNYWRCDGIIQLQQGDVCTDDGVDKLWLYSDALQREMRLDADRFQNSYYPSLAERRLLKHMAPYWTSTTYGFMTIPDPLGQIPNCMFQPFDKLCVLKLSACMFSYATPPFICCHNLRFLWLDHCRDRSIAAEAVKEEDIGRFFQRLWVLDVRYSNKAFLSDEMMGFMTQLTELNVMGEEKLDTSMFQGRINNIRKLRVTKSHVLTGQNIFSGSDKLELLEFSGNNFSTGMFSVEISCSSLETVVISGPTYLEKISLTGYANYKLKNILLSGSFPYLETIEITSAAVETLDLSAVEAPHLDGLRACGNLRSILWCPEAEGKRKRYLHWLHIDTSTHNKGKATAGTGREFGWHISVRDARILRSLEPVKDYCGSNDAHVEISSPSRLCDDATSGSKDNGIMSSSEQLSKDNATIYADVGLTTLKAYGGVRSHAPSPAIMRTCPPPPDVPPKGCYMHIEDPTSKTKSQTASIITLPGFICDAAKILHMHDSSDITGILDAPLASAAWNRLEWCRVERCPSLESVFRPKYDGEAEGNDDRHEEKFRKLRTTWASHLPNTRYIWKWSGIASKPENISLFRDMTLLHFECCPRLASIIDVPIFFRSCLYNLETLEIMWCGDLTAAFYLRHTVLLGHVFNWPFPKLKRIYLHELPKLRNISGIWGLEIRIRAPKLETIKIKGCWNLRMLPVVGSNKVVECDCEKEWWGMLKWESAEHAAQYKPTHPRHYKKTMLRGSILR